MSLYNEPDAYRRVSARDRDPDLDELLRAAESADELPDGVTVEVGGPLTPSEVRNAERLGRIKNSAWLWSDGRRTELRWLPKSLERAAMSRARSLRRQNDD